MASAAAVALTFYTEMVKLTALVFLGAVGAVGWLAGPTPLGTLERWRWIMLLGAMAFAGLLLVAGPAWLLAAFTALRDARTAADAARPEEATP